MKETNDQQIPKARLVIKGFEEPTKDEILKDSPTCSKKKKKKKNASSVKCYSTEEMESQFNRS